MAAAARWTGSTSATAARPRRSVSNPGPSAAIRLTSRRPGGQAVDWLHASREGPHSALSSTPGPPQVRPEIRVPDGSRGHHTRAGLVPRVSRRALVRAPRREAPRVAFGRAQRPARSLQRQRGLKAAGANAPDSIAVRTAVRPSHCAVGRGPGPNSADTGGGRIATTVRRGYRRRRTVPVERPATLLRRGSASAELRHDPCHAVRDATSAEPHPRPG